MQMRCMLFIFFIVPSLLQGMEAPESQSDDSQELKIPKHHIVIFDNALNHINVKKSLLKNSKPLTEKLHERQKYSALNNSYYKNRVISTDLDFVELDALKNALILAQEEQTHSGTTQKKELTEDLLKQIKEYKILPFYKCPYSNQDDKKLKSYANAKFTVLYEILTNFYNESNSSHYYDDENQKVSKAKEESERRASLGFKKKSSNRPAVFQAVEDINCKKVKKSIELFGENPFYKDEEENSFLHIVASSNDLLATNLLRYLIAFCNLDPCDYNSQGYTPVHVAIVSKEAEDNVYYFIKECCLNPLIETLKGLTCLHLAALTGNLDITRYLITDCKIDPCIQSGSKEQLTPLHYAAIAGQLEIGKYLIAECKVDPDILSGLGNTPLHCAIKTDQNHFALYLISEGAHSDISNNKGLTAIEFAEKSNQVIQEYIETSIIIKTLINKRSNAKCPICKQSIHSFGDNQRSLTPCCKKFVCAVDFRELKICPICTDTITPKERWHPDYSTIF